MLSLCSWRTKFCSVLHKYASFSFLCFRYWRIVTESKAVLKFDVTHQQHHSYCCSDYVEVVIKGQYERKSS